MYNMRMICDLSQNCKILHIAEIQVKQAYHPSSCTEHGVKQAVHHCLSLRQPRSKKRIKHTSFQASEARFCTYKVIHERVCGRSSGTQGGRLNKAFAALPIILSSSSEKSCSINLDGILSICQNTLSKQSPSFDNCSICQARTWQALFMKSKSGGAHGKRWYNVMLKECS